MRTSTSAAIVAGFAALAVLGTATAASAGSRESIGVVRTTTNSFAQPTKASDLVHSGLQPNTKVHIRCQTTGQEVFHNTTWVQVAVQGSDKLGFVPAGDVKSMDEVIPFCSAG
jgi:hypothetical protein